MICPYCGEGYTTASGLIHHLERSTCPCERTSRTSLYIDVRDQDPDRQISKSRPERRDHWCDGPDFATLEAWNWMSYKCDFCPQEFRTEKELTQHYNSLARKFQAFYPFAISYTCCSFVVPRRGAGRGGRSL